MNHCLTCLLLLMLNGLCHAQDTTTHAGPETVARSNKPSQNIHEKFSVLKTNKNIKQGLFQAFYKDEKLVASGRYENGKRIGRWRFSNTNGIIDQVYDYTNNKLLFTIKPDTSFIRFEFDTKINDADSLTYPIKIGGNFYGYHFFLSSHIGQLALDMRNDADDFMRAKRYSEVMKDYRCMHVLTVGADGILTKWQLLVTGKDFKELYDIKLDKVIDEDKLFIPATQNGKPIVSKVYIMMSNYHNP